MKRWLIILITISVASLMITLAIFGFWLDKISNWWFYGIGIGLATLLLIGLIIYKIRTMKKPIDLEKEKKDEKKIKSSDVLKEYVKKKLVESEEPNYLKNITIGGYVAGQQTKNAVRKEFGIIMGEGVYYLPDFGWAVYIISINLKDPDELYMEIFKKDEFEDKKSEIIKKIKDDLEKTADIPREEITTIEKTTDQYGRVISERKISTPTKKEIEEEEKEAIETLEKKEGA